MGTLIDSSILIAAERGKLDLQKLLKGEKTDRVAMAAITVSELLHGAHRAKTASQRAKREAFVEKAIAEFSVIPFDIVIARVHARVSAELAAKGIILGNNDLQIGATALALNYGVATRDKRSFPKIPGLSVAVW